MFCPVCHAEFIPGFTVCDECGVELVDELPAATPRGRTAARRTGRSSPEEAGVASSGSAARPVELVTIFSSGDAGMVALVKSVLTSAGIPFFDTWPVFGAGGVVQVDRADASDAETLLVELEASSGEPGDDLAEGDEDDGERADDEAEDERADDEAGEGQPGVRAPSAPTAPTPPSDIDPPARRGWTSNGRRVG